MPATETALSAVPEHTTASPDATALPQPAGLRYPIRAGDPPMRILNAFLGIPYTEDGAVDEQGRYTYFSRPEQRQTTVGLNCSGFVLGASRFLLGRNIPLSTAVHDRLRDSGPGSPDGQDWDFGWDLILNITEGLPRAFLLPGGKRLAVEQATGFTPRGFALQAADTWLELPVRLKPGRLYFVDFTKDTAKHGYRMRHYHVGLFHVDDSGALWLYQATGAAKKIYRRNLSNPDERRQFLRAFADTGKVRKHILVLEVTP